MTGHTPHPDVAAAVAAHVGAGFEAELAGGRNAWRRPTIAHSPWLTPTLARRFARSTQVDVRRAVAGNRATPPELLTQLLADELDVASAARANPSTPYPAVVAASASDGTPTAGHPLPLTEDMVSHPDCPPDVLLAALHDRWLNEHALRHRNLPAAVVRELAATGTTGHRPGTGTLELHAFDARHLDVRDLLDSPHLTHPEAAHLIYDLTAEAGGPSWREWIWCKHPNADPDWLADLADRRFDSADQGAIARIAHNPATPGPVLARILSGHAHRDVAAANPNCPPEALHAALDALDTVTVNAHRQLLAGIATNPAAPLEVLDRLPVSALRHEEHVRTFTLAHAHTALQARTVLLLAPTFTGTLADLLTAADGIAAPSATAPATVPTGA